MNAIEFLFLIGPKDVERKNGGSSCRLSNQVCFSVMFCVFQKLFCIYNQPDEPLKNQQERNKLINIIK